MAKNEKKPGPGLTPSLIVTMVGLVLACVGSWVAFQQLTEPQTSDTHPVPGTLERELDPGRYDIYTESINVIDIFDDDGAAIENLADGTSADVLVVVTDAAGQQLVVNPPEFDNVVGRGFTLFEHVGWFEAVEDGVYTVDIESDRNTSMVVGESIETAWRDALPWGIAATVGTLMFIAGIAMLVVGIVRRQRADKEQTAYAVPGIAPATPHPGAIPPAPGPNYGSPTAPPPPPPPSPQQQPPRF